MSYDYVIVGGGPTGMTIAWILSNQKKKVLLIEKDEVLGGCHKVLRVNGYFTEHGPRVYSNSFLMFIELLADMDIVFTDLFISFKYNTPHINSKKLNLTFNEIMALLLAFLKLIVNKDYGRTVSMKDFMKKNNFSESSYDFIKRLLLLTDGGSIQNYTLFQFLQLINQQLFYSLYQPKIPNDRGLIKIWTEKLLKNNVKILLNSKVVKIDVENNNVSKLIINENGIEKEIIANKYVLTIPPKPFYNLISSNPKTENIFGNNKELQKWKVKNSYFDYITLTFHYKNEIKLELGHGFSRSPWGIGFIIISNIMDFKTDEPSKTVISICISMLNNPNEEGKTVNQSSKEEIIKYVKEQLSFFPNPDLVIISPTVKRINDKWINYDTAYVVTTEQQFIKPKGKLSNLYYVGIHNGNSSYNFTAIESAVQNAIHYCIEEIPELKYRYVFKDLMEVRNLVIDAIIIIICIFLIINIKKYIKKT
jgi:protoporphyrinogen oxidase